MIGPSGESLYVGKSIRVRTRLLSYFRARRGEKAAEIIDHTHAVDWEYVPSEFASLLTEMRMIRRFRPVFNVQHKLDRGWGFLKITAESAPRLLVVREPRADGAIYFGPIRAPARLRPIAREIADALELRDCAKNTPLRYADQLDLFAAPQPPALCARPQLGRCLAPCAAGCTRGEYRDRVRVARGFLEGDEEAPARVLRARIRTAADRLQYEYAAELRDRLDALLQTREELREIRRALTSLSFVYDVPGWDEDDRVYIIRNGRIRAELPAPRTASDRGRLHDIASDLLAGRSGSPRFGTGATSAAEALLLLRWFRLHPEERSRTWVPA
jgi:excinuclease ABC subunit C